ncbi:iron-sulfur cluster assembly protein IscU [Salinisphaera sp. PC39]|uniref:iron-sulfur cluster assembly scaffold protein n=1 Tax=Salinisphaera sp. PC39 TaxID=1304156 RepID=UPI00333EB997
MRTQDYSETVVRRFLAPSHAGPPPDGGRVLTGRASAPGDLDLALYLSLAPDDVTIVGATFLARACPAGIAAADWACEWLRGRTLEEARGLTVAHIEAGAGLAPDRRDRGLLVEDALAAALARARDA